MGPQQAPDLGVSPFSLLISFPSALSFIVLPDMKESFPSEFCFFYHKQRNEPVAEVQDRGDDPWTSKW